MSPCPRAVRQQADGVERMSECVTASDIIIALLLNRISSAWLPRTQAAHDWLWGGESHPASRPVYPRCTCLTCAAALLATKHARKPLFSRSSPSAGTSCSAPHLRHLWAPRTADGASDALFSRPGRVRVHPRISPHQLSAFAVACRFVGARSWRFVSRWEQDSCEVPAWTASLSAHTVVMYIMRSCSELPYAPQEQRM
jgi:hypothetical protein